MNKTSFQEIRNCLRDCFVNYRNFYDSQYDFLYFRFENFS